MSKSPFEVRLEILKMAQDSVRDSYFATRDALVSVWDQKCTYALDADGVLPYPDIPPFPTDVDILARANQLYSFILDTGTGAR